MAKPHSQAGVQGVFTPRSQEREKTPRPRRLWHGLDKNWDRHVAHAEELSHTAGFEELRDMILEKAEPAADEQALDVGAGTGLLTLDLAKRVERVWAVDISPAMIECLGGRATAAGLDNVQTAVVSATQLPIADGSLDLATSNYCFHHLGTSGKREALAEIHRVLKPGGRLVFADMMFTIAPFTTRDRTVIAAKVRSLARRGPAGFWRLTKAGLRTVTNTGEHPAPTEWWRTALAEAGFVEIVVEPLAHEGGIAVARKPR
jgi:ubiquinone/menaquinone biosynthesis C-methylase UbiE